MAYGILGGRYPYRVSSLEIKGTYFLTFLPCASAHLRPVQQSITTHSKDIMEMDLSTGQILS